jgi:endonuclease/exonuclease/phosphatase family metal-dependent hydrolase
MRRVIISSIDGDRFLGPTHRMQGDPLETVGKLKVVGKPYHWLFNKDNRITTTNGQFVWDRYDQESSTVYLYPRVTQSPMQLFPLKKGDLLHLSMGTFRVEDLWSGDESVVLQGGEVTFHCISKPGGKFRHPVFFAPSAKLSTEQFKSQPTLLMHDVDWKYTLKETHPGAFGSDYDVYAGKELPGKWIVVWKFPKDLNWISGYEPILDVALPVGAYPFLRDNWDKKAPRFTHPLLPVDETVVEKLRTDFADGHSVHLLKNRETGYEVAIMSSQYFIKELRKVTKPEKVNVQKMFKELYAENIYAFSCFSQHHAIVFYMDKTNETLLSPTKLGQILRSSDTRGKRIRSILQKYAIQDTGPWTLNYAKIKEVEEKETALSFRIHSEELPNKLSLPRGDDKEISFSMMSRLETDPTVVVLVSKDRRHTIDVWDEKNPVVSVHTRTSWNVLQQFKKQPVGNAGFHLVSLVNNEAISSSPDGVIGFGGVPLLFRAEDTTIPRKYVTYNVAHGVMTHEAGWEEEVVVPCIAAHGKKRLGGLTACARLGVELVASQSPEVIGIQEFASLQNGRDWVRYLREVSGCDYQLHMDASQGGKLLCAILWKSLGPFRPLYTRDPKNRERCVAIFDKEAKFVIVSIHVSHKNAMNGIQDYVESLWDPTEIRPDHIVLMGDFNDTYPGGKCNSMKLWGKTVTLRNPGMRTCCADEERLDKAYPLNYPHKGDYFYTTDSMLGEATLVEDGLLRTSDHRAVMYHLN